MPRTPRPKTRARARGGSAQPPLPRIPPERDPPGAGGPEEAEPRPGAAALRAGERHLPAERSRERQSPGLQGRARSGPRQHSPARPGAGHAEVTTHMGAGRGGTSSHGDGVRTPGPRPRPAPAEGGRGAPRRDRSQRRPSSRPVTARSLGSGPRGARGGQNAPPRPAPLTCPPASRRRSPGSALLSPPET